jgi:hypothetical protein
MQAAGYAWRCVRLHNRLARTGRKFHLPDGGLSHGQPTTIVCDVGSMTAYRTATRDHSRILIRVIPDAANDKGEIRLLFGWQGALRQSKR